MSPHYFAARSRAFSSFFVDGLYPTDEATTFPCGLMTYWVGRTLT